MNIVELMETDISKDLSTRASNVLTRNGLRALGDPNVCSTGLDCGAYILAHHKLWDGFVAIENCTSQDGDTCNGCADNYVLGDNVCHEKLTGCDTQNGNTCMTCDNSHVLKDTHGIDNSFFLSHLIFSVSKLIFHYSLEHLT